MKRGRETLPDAWSLHSHAPYTLDVTGSYTARQDDAPQKPTRVCKAGHIPRPLRQLVRPAAVPIIALRQPEFVTRDGALSGHRIMNLSLERTSQEREELHTRRRTDQGSVGKVQEGAHYTSARGEGGASMLLLRRRASRLAPDPSEGAHAGPRGGDARASALLL